MTFPTFYTQILIKVRKLWEKNIDSQKILENSYPQFTAIKKIQEPQFDIYLAQKMSKAMDIILILFLWQLRIKKQPLKKPHFLYKIFLRYLKNFLKKSIIQNIFKYRNKTRKNKLQETHFASDLLKIFPHHLLIKISSSSFPTSHNMK